jgi:ribosome-associated protein
MSSATDLLIVNDRVQIPLSEFDFLYSRSSGPGGQNVNKVSSKVQLRWDLIASPSLPADIGDRFRALNRRRITTEGVFTITSQEFRDQPRNRANCLDKLRELLVEACTVPRRRKATRVPRSAKRRRLADKKQRSERKQGRQRPRMEE